MLSRLLILAAIIGASYWYWSGPYQEKINPSYEATLSANHKKMAECIRSAAYKLGATGQGAGAELAETECAEKYNLYQLEGRWHSYDAARRD